MDVSLLKKMREALRVFSKEYKKESQYRKFMDDNVNNFKLKIGDDYDISERIQRLKLVRNNEDKERMEE